MRKPAVKSLVLALLTVKFCSSSYDNSDSSTILEFGFSNKSVASIAVPDTHFVLLGSLLMGTLAAKRISIQVYLHGSILHITISLIESPCLQLLGLREGELTKDFYALT